MHWANVNWYPFTIKEESCNCQNNAFWSKNVDHHILIPSFISWVSALTWSDTLEFKNFIWSNHEILEWCQRKTHSCNDQHKIKFFSTSDITDLTLIVLFQLIYFQTALKLIYYFYILHFVKINKKYFLHTLNFRVKV